MTGGGQRKTWTTTLKGASPVSQVQLLLISKTELCLGMEVAFRLTACSQGGSVKDELIKTSSSFVCRLWQPTLLE